MRILAMCMVAGLLVTGCEGRSGAEGGPEVAVTNSYLESVVRDLCGDETEVMSLASPGMCPGHFDISPGQIRQLRNCRLLVGFDFQSQIGSALERLRADGLKTCFVTGPTGLCVPDSYLATCGEVAGILAREFPERAEAMAGRLAAIEQRLVRLEAELRDSVVEVGVDSAEVLASHRQSRFAAWLGLRVAAGFAGSDTETVGHIDHCLKQVAGHDVRLVIANRQEGAALARALAERLGARAVIFSNFPSAGGEAPGFDRLLRDNVARLREAMAE